MTKTADLFIFGKLDGIYQSVKIIPLKKITADEVEFYSGDEKMDMDVSLWQFMKDRDILVAGKKAPHDHSSKQQARSFVARLVRKNCRWSF